MRTYLGISMFRHLGVTEKEVEALRGIGMSDDTIDLRLRDIDTIMRAGGLTFELAVNFCQDTDPGWTLQPFATLLNRYALRALEIEVNRKKQDDDVLELKLITVSN